MSITRTTSGTIFRTVFPGSSLEACLTGVTSGAGTNTVGSGVLTQTSGADIDVAYIVNTTALPTDKKFVVRAKIKVASDITATIMDLHDEASRPSAAYDNAAYAGARRPSLYRYGTLNTAWQSGGLDLGAMTVGTDYIIELASDASKVIALKRATDLSILAQDANLWGSAALPALAHSPWVLIGDVIDNAWSVSNNVIASVDAFTENKLSVTGLATGNAVRLYRTSDNAVLASGVEGGAVTAYSIQAINSGGYAWMCPKDWTLHGSNDDFFAEDVTLDTQAGASAWSPGEIRKYSITNDTYYRYLKLVVSDTQAHSSTGVAIAELEFYGGAAQTETMTAATKGSVTVMADADDGTHFGWWAFSKIAEGIPDGWCSLGCGHNDGWLKYDFGVDGSANVGIATLDGSSIDWVGLDCYISVFTDNTYASMLDSLVNITDASGGDAYELDAPGPPAPSLKGIRRVSAASIFNKLGDNAGAEKFSIQDSDDVEVFAVDSDGTLTPAPTPASHSHAESDVTDLAGDLADKVNNGDFLIEFPVSNTASEVTLAAAPSSVLDVTILVVDLTTGALSLPEGQAEIDRACLSAVGNVITNSLADWTPSNMGGSLLVFYTPSTAADGVSALFSMLGNGVTSINMLTGQSGILTTALDTTAQTVITAINELNARLMQGFANQGAWSSGTYAPYDVVTNAGATYLCILAVTGATAPPSDPTHWLLWAAKGDAGTNGTDGTDGADSTVPGPPGTDGTDGVTPVFGVDYHDGADGSNGLDGTNGTDGADSTVPGPQGPAGPACPLTDLTDVTITSGEQGDLIYRNAAGEWVNLHHGNAGEVLASGGNGANPSWAAAGAPGAHKATHEDGGTDEISIAGLAGTPGALTTHVSSADHDGRYYTEAEVDGKLPAHGCSAYLSAPLANITDNTYTLLHLDAEYFDSGGDFDATTNHDYTVPHNGIYMVTGAIVYTSASVIADKLYICAVYVDGTGARYDYRHSSHVKTVAPGVTDMLTLTAGQKLTLYAYVSTGANTVDISSARLSVAMLYPT